MMLKRLIDSDPNSLKRHAVVSLTSLGKIGKMLEEKGVVVYALNMKSFRDFFKILLKLKKLILEIRPGIIQTWMYHADLIGGISARLAGKKEIIGGIRQTSFSPGDSRATYMVMRACAVFSWWIPKAIVCCAESARKSHIAYGFDSRKMKVITNGFDVERFVENHASREQLRSELGYGASNKVIGIIGRFDAAKDHHNFIRAAAHVAKMHPEARFMMVGRNLDANNKILMDWIQKTGYADYFMLLGERDDVPACLSAMDIFCLSSEQEGFPNVVGEAMASGLPCVVTDVGDAAVLVDATGIIVPPKDSTALANGLLKMLALDDHQYQEFSLMAKNRIQERFTMPKIREQFELLYREVCNEKD